MFIKCKTAISSKCMHNCMHIGRIKARNKLAPSFSPYLPVTLKDFLSPPSPVLTTSSLNAIPKKTESYSTRFSNTELRVDPANKVELRVQ